jgi:hypothetical protein
MSTQEVKVLVFTNMTQSTPTNEPPITPHTVQSEHTEVDPQSPTAPTTNMAINFNKELVSVTLAPPAERAQIDDVDMLDTEISSIDGGADGEKAPCQSLKSRFATLGLNARPLEFAGRKRRSPSMLVHTEERPPVQTTYQRNWMRDKEDLTDLETLLIPAGLRQAYRDGGASPMDPRPPAPRMKSSKYSTGFLIESGWHAVNNDQWKIASEQIHTNQDLSNVTLVDEFVGYNDLPSQLAKAIAVIKEPLDKADFDAAVAELTKDAETPLVHGKYFDPDQYLNHAQRSYRRPAKKGSPTKSVIVEVSNIAPMLPIPGPSKQLPGKGNGVKSRKNIQLPMRIKNKTNAQRRPLAESASAHGDSTSTADKATLPVVSEMAVVASSSDAPNSLDSEMDIAVPGEDDTAIDIDLVGVDQKGKWELLDSDTALLQKSSRSACARSRRARLRRTDFRSVRITSSTGLKKHTSKRLYGGGIMSSIVEVFV